MYTVKIYNEKAQASYLVEKKEFTTRKEAENYMYKKDEPNKVIWLFEDDDFSTSLDRMKFIKERRINKK